MSQPESTDSDVIEIPGLTDVSRVGDFLVGKDSEGRLIAYRGKPYWASLVERAIKASGMEYAINTMTFDAFHTKTPLQEQMKKTAEAYVAALASGLKPWFFVSGQPGCGKTHICTAICGRLMKQHGMTVKYMKWIRDAQFLKSQLNTEGYELELSQFTNASILYIDDLFKQTYGDSPKVSDADIRLAFLILDERVSRNLPTIISTEWDLMEQLMPADEGVFSRVYEKCKGYIISVSRNRENNYRIDGGLI